MENYFITKLDNGISVISENISYVQSFSLGCWFNVGTRDEAIENNGITHFIEHMIFKGTKNRNSKKISEEIESLGGYLNAFTSKENTCFYARGLEKNIEKTFKVVADIIQNPLFKNSDIKKEAGVVIDELHDINDNPEELIFDKFEEVLFSGNSLCYPIIGTENNIRKFNNETLHKYFNQNFVPKNLLIVCSGAVEHEKLVSLTKKYFNRKEERIKTKRKIISLNYFDELMIDKEIQQVHCILGKNSFGYDDKRRVRLNLLSILLGDGSSSRLYQSIREKLGITYQINSFINSYQDISAFGVYFSTNDKQVDKVLNIIYKEFNKLKQNKVNSKELKRIKEYLKGNMLLSLENTTNRMIRIANSMLYFNRIVPIEEIIQSIDETNSDDLQKLACELLDENKMTKIFIRSKKKILKSAA